MKVKSESPEIVKESQRKATYEVSLALSSFLNYLQETDQPDTYLLLLSIAAGAGYEVNKTFQYLLGCDDLKFLLHEMRSAQDQYQRIKNISSYKAQAFMIHSGLTATARVTTISSEKKMQCLTLMKQHMGPSLSKEVAQVLTKLGADHDWENLEIDLRLLIAGDHETTVPSLQMDEMRMQLQSLLDCKKQPHELQGSESNKQEVIENEAFRSLLQRLGLEHYYPKRMGRANFNLINKTSVYNTHPSSEQELPFYFLEKLLMLDYGLRYLVFQDNGNTEHQVYSTASNQEKEIMNWLLIKRKHDVFFHRHCIGSSKDYLLMGGVIEICWFCPGGEEEDRFNNCVTFANLHGDAKEHRRQLTFLQEVSSLIVVLMSASDENKENRKICHDLFQSPRPLICLLDDREKTMTSNSGQRVKIGIRNRNEAELTQELTTTIRRLLELSDTALSLEDCALIAHKHGFLIDENQNDCKETKEKAQTIMVLLKEIELSQVKENLLPLQGQLWHLWCKKDKELYHLREIGNRSIEQHKSEIETAKQIIHHKQLTKAFPPNDLMRSVLQILLLYSETNTKLYFIQWLSMFMDNLTAEHLEKLREKQRHVWSLIQTKKKKVSKGNSLQSWQNEMEVISTEISKCPLGIDQLLREVGQIYEALEEASSINDSLFLSLPQIAADLMISGAPIELMDGDVSYVPLKWVAAVFDKVSEKLGDKRLFVLSIVGLQSSGKSTLLNALFGLQFTFSAGRYTHGAYMQLLKVEKTFTEELGFDFVLVVNTEGLQSPELTNKSQNRDHELVTFVIGLGNLTLINIFGENLSEIQDILQIAVQAFVRMKQVKIFPSCFFVHQNVGEVIDKDRAMERLRCLELRLDEMAAIAAEQEQCSDVTRFSDVIKFDVSTHVYYFAHLWDGNPPMAPPNPRYSHNVQELKDSILMTAKQDPRGSLMKISNVKFRVQDLWRALVNENFIFSFRNIQEVMAMSKLETKYNEWTWELRSHVLNLYMKISNQIQNGQIVALERSTLEAPVTEKYESIMQELEMYFNEDPYNEILIQCKADFENKLRNLEGLISDSRRKANELISLKNSQKRLDKKKADYKKYILERSRKLALTVKDKEMSEEELHEIFNAFWMKWVSEVSSSLSPVEEPNIDMDSENILLEYFQQEKNLVDILHRNYGQKFEIDYIRHVRIIRKFLIIERQLEARDRESIDRTTECIITRVNETINNIQRQQRDYSPSDFHEILRIVDEEMKYASTEERYTLTRQYKIDLSLYLFKKAAEKFKEMHRAFKRANDPVHYLERKKDDFFMRFKISCQGATSI
ncbi:Interferon-induced very large GTPase 1 [Tupaia chinensis]|uniref:Interferon-induced very large GTPase 1 n=1 Tax=Tupaia chinensis TaxID=246437 RepID=L9KVC5_TUPCH|nr:Interferon-induced very large GTPase 1 [Tupaia chinensis]